MSGEALGAFDVVDSRITHEGVLTTLQVDAVRMPDGSVADREVALRPDAVAVVAVTADGDVVLVRQYRHAVGGYETEIPAGLLDVEDEDPVDAARRELAEETGFGAGRVRRLLEFANSAGWSSETTTVYLAEDLQRDEADGFVAEAEEADMDVDTVPFREALAMVGDGRIRDAKTVIGLLFVAQNGLVAA